ncbi:MAG: SUMF1/EgtB/PvdO family nonheme iron enzyme [Methyloprofundus sp.]|nr:SUMF1/EgtB/PvdO family nonheme iron enzyme [Methyloprofundus sp.]
MLSNAKHTIEAVDELRQQKTILLPDIDWVEIPAAKFIYGEKESQQTLHLEKFYISRYPITNSQYQSFMDAGGYQDKRYWQGLIKPEPKEPRWSHSNRPRETVNWYEAVAFSRWLTEQLGLAIRLPTEQQWEKAARGTAGLEYPWGELYQSGYANTNEEQGLQATTAVGVFQQGASPYGVLDMAGNVWEWCLNKYESPEMIDSDNSGDSRVLRGGSWLLNSMSSRCALRLRLTPDLRRYSIGFRVVCLSPFTEH